MMQFGFCNLAVIAVRKEPSDRSEMTTQLLFGDLFEVLEEDGSWVFIKNYFDGYLGWIDKKQTRHLEAAEFHRLAALPMHVNLNPWGDTIQLGSQAVRIPAGSSVYGLENNHFTLDGLQCTFDGAAHPYKFTNAAALLESAMAFLSCPYLWGGKTCLGFDCSGFTQLVYKLNGMMLKRDAVQQAAQGEQISFISDSLPGDLVFFDNAEGHIVHVGILIDEQKLIHCSGKVRVDAIDHHGIYNKDISKYTHNLRLIRRVI
jgi:cell wall-associated NlpC family hydrolase